MKGWQKYLMKNLNARVGSNDGTPVGLYKVILQFVIDQDGNIREVLSVIHPIAAQLILTVFHGPKL